MFFDTKELNKKEATVLVNHVNTFFATTEARGLHPSTGDESIDASDRVARGFIKLVQETNNRTVLDTLAAINSEPRKYKRVIRSIFKNYNVNNFLAELLSNNGNMSVIGNMIDFYLDQE